MDFALVDRFRRAWDEHKHPRGQPKNKGEFARTGHAGGSGEHDQGAVANLLVEASKVHTGADWQQGYARMFKKRLNLPESEQQLTQIFNDAKDAHTEYAGKPDTPKHNWQDWYASFFIKQRQGLSGRAYVSPNQGAPTSFKQAERRSNAPETRNFAQLAKQVAAKAGLRVQVRRAVGDWAPPGQTPGAEPSTEIEFAGAKSYEQIKYAASLLGMHANQIAVLPWQDRKDGPDSMWELTINDHPERIRKFLDNYGLPYRTLVNAGGKTKVVIYDGGTQEASKVRTLAKHYGIQASRRRGQGEFFPAGITAADDAGQRQQARQAYQQYIQQYEAGQQPGGTGGRELVHRNHRAGTGSRLSARFTDGLERYRKTRQNTGKPATHTLAARFRRALDNVRLL